MVEEEREGFEARNFVLRMVDEARLPEAVVEELEGRCFLVMFEVEVAVEERS